MRSKEAFFLCYARPSHEQTPFGVQGREGECQEWEGPGHDRESENKSEQGQNPGSGQGILGRSTFGTLPRFRIPPRALCKPFKISWWASAAGWGGEGLHLKAQQRWQEALGQFGDDAWVMGPLPWGQKASSLQGNSSRLDQLHHRKAKIIASPKRIMRVAFFDAKDMIYCTVATIGTSDSDACIKMVSNSLVHLHKKRPEKQGSWLLHQDNTRPRVSRATEEFMEKRKMKLIPHALYSPDLALDGFGCSLPWRAGWLATNSMRSLRPVWRECYNSSTRVAL